MDSLDELPSSMSSGTIQNNQKSKSMVSNFYRSMIQEVEISKFFCSVHSRVICLVSASLIRRMDMSLPHAGKSHNLSQNVHVNCSLLELSSRHVVMLQVKVLQVANIRQLVDNYPERRLIFGPNSRLLLNAHAMFLTHFVPVWQTDLARLEVLFFFIHSAYCGGFTLQRFFFGCRLHKKFVIFVDIQSLWWAGYVAFLYDKAKITCSSANRSLTRLWLTRKTTQIQHNVPLRSLRLEKSTSQKQDM